MSTLKNKNLSLVKLGKSALKTVSHCSLQKDIITVLNETDGLDILKENHFFVLLKSVCELAENSDYKTSKDKLKLDKKQIVLDALLLVFPELNNDLHRKIISQFIDFVCSEKLIKKIPQTTIITNNVVDVVSRRFF